MPTTFKNPEQLASTAKNELISLDDYFDYLESQEHDLSVYAYEKYADSLARKESTRIISNGNKEHAQVIYSILLSRAKREFRLLSGSLRPEIYSHDSVINSLTEFLSKKNTQIKIILQDESIICLEELRKKNKFVDVCLNLTDNDKDKCIIKKTTGKDSDLGEHFAIMDQTGYRYCPLRDITKAIATFNGVSIATHLKEQFEILLKRSVSIPESC